MNFFVRIDCKICGFDSKQNESKNKTLAKSKECKKRKKQKCEALKNKNVTEPLDEEKKNNGDTQKEPTIVNITIRACVMLLLFSIAAEKLLDV